MGKGIHVMGKRIHIVRREEHRICKSTGCVVGIGLILQRLYLDELPTIWHGDCTIYV